MYKLIDMDVAVHTTMLSLKLDDITVTIQSCCWYFSAYSANQNENHNFIISDISETISNSMYILQCTLEDSTAAVIISNCNIPASH